MRPGAGIEAGAEIILAVNISYGTTVKYSFKWQYMAGAGAGAEIMDKGGA